MQVNERRIDLAVGPASPSRGRGKQRAARVGRRSCAPVACGAYARLHAFSGLPQALASALAWLSSPRLSPVIATNHGRKRINPGLTLPVSHGWLRQPRLTLLCPRRQRQPESITCALLGCCNVLFDQILLCSTPKSDSVARWP